jgi:phosphoglycolate phosphatase-like HAD superfamily hydrolase
MTNLAVFDLDGTLLDTNGIDSVCFVAAWQEELGISCEGISWSTFEHVTDSGIAREILRREGLESGDHAARVERRLIELLQRAAEQDPSKFRPIDGAAEMLETLHSRGWSAVIATGAWGGSAMTKLRAAGSPFERLPVSAACGERCSREEIVQHAIALAASIDGRETYERIVVFGDAAWDVKTARNLALPFIGVARGDRHRRLRNHGAEHVLEDFKDRGAVIRALDEAVVPRAVS